MNEQITETQTVISEQDNNEGNEENKKSIIKALKRDSNINGVLLCMFFVIEFSATFLLKFISKKFMSSMPDQTVSNILTMILYFIMYPIGMPLIFFVFRKLSKKHKDMRIKDCFKKPKMSAGWVVRWIFITIGITYAITFASNIFFLILESLTHFKLNPAEFQTDISSPVSIITFSLALPVFAPLFEELLFRGTIFRNVREYGTWSMIIICGVTFGLWHLNYQQLIYAAAMGVMSCLLFEKTESIIPSMIVHFCVNSIGLFQLFTLSGVNVDQVSSGDLSYLTEHPGKYMAIMAIGFLIITLIITGIILLIVELVCFRDSFIIKRKNKELSGGKAFGYYISSPVMIIAMVFMTAMTIYYAIFGR